ncbi:MAG: hypothetical protein ACLFUS_10635 [Candidatus Sumerlaeia bacterium]
MPQLYFISSSDAKWVSDQREKLVRELIPDELRDENLTEYYATGNAPLSLDKILEDIVGELSTLPLLPDSRRVVVVHDLRDFVSGGRSRAKSGGKKSGGKRSAADALIDFAKNDLPSTENVLIFSTIIDHSRGHYLDKNNALIKFIGSSQIGSVIKPPYNEQDPLFLMGDALMERNTQKCLRHFRAIYSDDNRSRMFRELLRIVRFLVQAKVISKKEESGARKATLESLLPEDRNLNIYKLPPFVQKKINRNAGNFNVRELMCAMERLLEINTYLFPSQRMKHVPDTRFLMETFIIEFCEGQIIHSRSA